MPLPEEIKEKISDEAIKQYSTPFGRPNPETYAFITGAELGYELGIKDAGKSSTSVKGEEQEKDDQIKLWEEIAKKVGGFNDFREWVEKFTEQYTLIKKQQS